MYPTNLCCAVVGLPMTGLLSPSPQFVVRGFSQQNVTMAVHAPSTSILFARLIRVTVPRPSLSRPRALMPKRSAVRHYPLLNWVMENKSSMVTSSVTDTGFCGNREVSPLFSIVLNVVDLICEVWCTC